MQPAGTGDPRGQWSLSGNKITSRAGEVLDISRKSGHNGAEVISYKDKNDSNQHWRFEYVWNMTELFDSLTNYHKFSWDIELLTRTCLLLLITLVKQTTTNSVYESQMSYKLFRTGILCFRQIYTLLCQCIFLKYFIRIPNFSYSHACSLLKVTSRFLPMCSFL